MDVTLMAAEMDQEQCVSFLEFTREGLEAYFADLGEPVSRSATPLEAARSIDSAFVPLATTYGASLYGEHESTVAVIESATLAHTQAVQHVTTRYSSMERALATLRPTMLLDLWSRVKGRRNGNGSSR